MVVTFPVECTSPEDKLRWCREAKNELRSLQNTIAMWYKTGLTQEQYDQLPQKVRTRLPYKAKIPIEDLNDFTRNIYYSLEKAIISANIATDNEIEGAKRFSVDFDSDIK